MRRNAFCEETLDRHRPANGMYSEQVLSEVLISDGRWQLDASCYSAPLSVLSHMSRDDGVGAAVYCPGYWVALRQFDSMLWLLDSLKPWPVRLGNAQDAPLLASMSQVRRMFGPCGTSRCVEISAEDISISDAPTEQEETSGQEGPSQIAPWHQEPTAPPRCTGVTLEDALRSDVNLLAQQPTIGEFQDDTKGWVPKDLDAKNTFNTDVDGLLQLQLLLWM